eukprot:68884-Prymnesium_polylepis.1
MPPGTRPPALHVARSHVHPRPQATPPTSQRVLDGLTRIRHQLGILAVADALGLPQFVPERRRGHAAVSRVSGLWPG